MAKHSKALGKQKGFVLDDAPGFRKPFSKKKSRPQKKGPRGSKAPWSDDTKQFGY